MEPVDRLLNDFIEAWNAGGRPQVDEYVDRAPEAERDELAVLIGAFLEIAPTPPYSAEQLDELRRDPMVRKIASLVADESGATTLPGLRERAKLKREQVVEGLARTLGLEGQETKIQRRYHQLEIGTITPSQLTQKLLDALAKVLRVAPDEIERAGAYFHLSPEPAVELYLRSETLAGPEVADEERLEAAASRAPVPEHDWDEVDRLFLGGR
jgi:hypothetical protein